MFSDGKVQARTDVKGNQNKTFLTLISGKLLLRKLFAIFSALSFEIGLNKLRMDELGVQSTYSRKCMHKEGKTTRNTTSKHAYKYGKG